MSTVNLLVPNDVMVVDLEGNTKTVYDAYPTYDNMWRIEFTDGSRTTLYSDDMVMLKN